MASSVPITNSDVESLFQRVRDLNLERDNILNQIKVIQVNCLHSQLPKRNPGDEYMDTCPGLRIHSILLFDWIN